MKSREYSHYILTRFNNQNINGFLYDDYNAANKWMDERMELFAETRRSVLNQEEPFKWVIALDKRTPNRFVQEIVTDSRMRVVYSDVRETFKEIQVSTPWVITSRLDNDDLYLPGAIKAIQDCFDCTEKVVDLKYEMQKGDEFRPSGRRQPNSPFLSLIEKTDKAIRTCFARPHTKMVEEYPAFWAHRKPKAIMLIHGNNVSNQNAW